MKVEGDSVWAFVGAQGRFPSAVFHTLPEAEAWVESVDGTGVLTEYPVGESVFDWVTRNELWTPKQDHQKTTSFPVNFSSAMQEHEHYEDGRRVS